MECIGVIEVPLKKRTKVSCEKDKLLLNSTPHLGIDHCFEK
jgi:hypothetical protein